MKSFLITLFSLVGFVSYSQETPGFELPNYAAKTPEAAAFLKYGEYPVDLSTGIPTISLPIYTIKAKGLEIPITLNYHAGGIKVNQEASWVGLGWNVNFGAQVVLSVRDAVDENDGSIDNIPGQADIDYYTAHPYAFSTGPILTGMQTKKSWVKDFYQFTSPTISGSFYIKDFATNDIVIYPPEAFKVKLIGANRENMSFEITDKNGTIYRLGTIEKSIRSLTHQDDYTSAWFVDQIETSSHDIIYYNYEDDGQYEEYNYSQKYEVSESGQNCPSSGCLTNQYQVSSLKTEYGYTTTYSKKIKEIIFDNGLSKVSFEKAGSRPDLVNGNSYLDKIKILRLDQSGNTFELVRGFGFVYSYFNDSYSGTQPYWYKRLKLERMETLLEGDAHIFSYNSTPLPAKTSFAVDHYGFYNGQNNSNLVETHTNVGINNQTVGSANREVSNSSILAGILTEIKYPTKGSTQFTYENNTYWGIKNTATTATFGNYVTGNGNGGVDPVGDENDPWPGDLYQTQCASGCVVYFTQQFSGAGTGTINATISNDVEDDISTGLQKQYGRIRVFLNSQTLPVYDSGKKFLNWSHHEEGLQITGPGYIVVEAWGGHITAKGFVSIESTVSSNTNIPCAGVRIKAIKNVNHDGNFVGQKNYEYNIDGTDKSSGILTNGNEISYASGYNGSYQISGNALTFTRQYNISSQSRFGTENSSVTYEYVKETQLDELQNQNGYTKYRFTTGGNYMRDGGLFIALNGSIGKLLEQSDYKRVGSTFLQVRKQKTDYIEDQSKISHLMGLKISRRSSINVFENTSNPTQVPTPYASFIGMEGVPGNVNAAVDFIGYDIAIPWYHQSAQEETSYFYDSYNQLTSTIVTNKIYGYNNPNHLQISSEVVTNSLGETIQTKYFYPGDTEVSTEPLVSDLISKNILIPLKVQSFKAGNKLSERKTVYKNWGSNLFMPELIQGSKGSGDLENRVRFVNVNSANGNVQQLRQENGIDVTYLWGYAGVYPIAKIEGATFAQVLSVLGTTEQDISTMTIAPANIRTLLPNAMVTTYTYSPLLGVETITDPKGDTTTYKYDNQGRLLTVKDNFGKILSENTYNYRSN